MGQYWLICSLDKREVVHFGKIYTLWWDAEIIIQRLVRNLPRHLPEHSERAVVGQKSPLLNLPVELLVLIVEHLNVVDCQPLSLASRKLWNLASSKAQQKPWTGHRILCFGDYHEFDFTSSESITPPGLLTQAECDLFTDLQEHGSTQGMSEVYHRHDEFPKYSCKHGWMLRNLTRKEFVLHGDLVATVYEGVIRKKQYAQNREPLALAGALVCRLFWSSDPTNMPRADIRHGQWSGHRLDVCLVATHCETAGSGWRDVTLDVAKDLRNLMDMEFEDDYSVDYESSEEAVEEPVSSVKKNAAGVDKFCIVS